MIGNFAMQSHFSEMVLCEFIYFSPRHADACLFREFQDENQIVYFVMVYLFLLLLHILLPEQQFFFFVFAAAAINKTNTVKKMKRTNMHTHTREICMKQTKFRTKLILCPNLCTKKFILASNERAMHQKRAHRHIGTNIPLSHFFFSARWRSLIRSFVWNLSMCFPLLFAVNFRCIVACYFSFQSRPKEILLYT